MTAHRRGPLLRIAVVGALVSGAVLLPAAPALADVNVAPGGMELNAGESRQITVTLTGGDIVNPPDQTTFTVSNDLGSEVSLSGCGDNGRGLISCGANDYENNQLKITVAAKNPSGLQPGQNREGSIAVRAGGGNNENVDVRVKGPAQVASVTEVSGKVVNQSTGQVVPNALISLKDSANSEHSATANSKGEFRIAPQGNKPIAPGALTLTATVEGFADGTANANGVAGKAVNGVQIRMKPTAASAAPSAPIASEGPTEDPSAAATDLAQPSKTAGDSGGPSLLSWLLIGMGVLLVLLGVGAIVLLLMRRKDDGGDAGDDYAEPGPNRMAPVGAAAGGAYRGGPDRTMVAGSPGMNDATAIVGPQQQLDEFPDPYAAAPTRGGYGGYGGAPDQATSVAPGYGHGGGYGEEPGYGRGEPGYSNGGGHRDERGYDSPRGGGYGGGGNGYGGGGGYGESPRGQYADEPTGQYSPGAGGGSYPSAGYPSGPAGPAGHGAPANGYGPAGYGPAGHGSAGHSPAGHGGPANGYGPGGGYDDAPRGGGDYGRSGGGYPSAGGPSAGGYERPPSDYGTERGGDPRNGRGRSVDWLD